MRNRIIFSLAAVLMAAPAIADQAKIVTTEADVTMTVDEAFDLVTGITKAKTGRPTGAKDGQPTFEMFDFQPGVRDVLGTDRARVTTALAPIEAEIREVYDAKFAGVAATCQVVKADEASAARGECKTRDRLLDIPFATRVDCRQRDADYSQALLEIGRKQITVKLLRFPKAGMNFDKDRNGELNNDDKKFAPVLTDFDSGRPE